ncbi:MAG: response regulator [Clostridium sp.]|nr:response regulator [Clostridium sp.]
MRKLCKVLIVDDELIMRQGISHMIDWEKEGFELIGQASNGEEALEIIKQNTPNIVLTDVVMPKMDGVKLIKLLENSYPDIKIIVLSSYSDFDYVKTSFKYGAIDYILKPTLNIDELIKTLKNTASQINGIELSPSDSSSNSDSVLYDLMNGSYNEGDLNALRKTLKYDSFSLFGAPIKILNLNYETKKKLHKDIIYFLENFINDDIIIKEIKFKDDLLLYLLNSNTKNFLYLSKNLKDISEKLKETYPNLSFVLSRSFISLTNLKDIYENNFTKLVDISFYYKNNSFINESYYKKDIQSVKFDFNKFYELTSQLKIDSSISMLSAYIDEVINNKSINKFELKSLIQNCFYNITSALDSKNIKNSDELKKLKYRSFSLIEDSIYAQDLLENYRHVCSEFEKILKDNFIDLNSHMIDKIIKYLNENYDKQLTLTEVSNMFNFNYYYLSSYFGAHNKEGFNEFLNKIRIEKACEFLKQDMPISKVCGMVGYADHSYFTKVFKKFTGMTPSSYRKSNNFDSLEA